MKFNFPVYLIGVDHNIQFGCSDKKDIEEQYKVFVRSTIRDKSIQVIAEECNKDGLKKFGANQTLVQRLIDDSKLLIEDIFVDPNFEQRKKLGIRLREEIAKELGIFNENEDYSKEEQDLINSHMAPYDNRREYYWIEQLEKNLNKRILFIVGDKHVESLRSKIEETAGNVCSIIQNFK